MSAWFWGFGGDHGAWPGAEFVVGADVGTAIAQVDDLPVVGMEAEPERDGRGGVVMGHAGQPAGVRRQRAVVTAMYQIGGPEEHVALFGQEALVFHAGLAAGGIELVVVEFLVVDAEGRAFRAVLEQI